MINANIRPIIFQIGDFQLTYYTLVFIAGFIVALLCLLRAIRKKQIEMTKEQAYELISVEIIAVTIGARLFHILFWGWKFYTENPSFIPKVWLGGLSFHGGLVGALVGGYIYTRIKKINFAKLADILVFPVLIFSGLQRISNFINQEIVGTVTNFSWCLKFEGFEGCRHPVQLYASAGKFALLFFLLYLKKMRPLKDGLLFWIFIFFTGVGRFALDFIREDSRFFYLSAGQWLAIPMIFISLYFLRKNYR